MQRAFLSTYVEVLLFFILGVPAVVLGFMLARWVDALSPKRQTLEADARFLRMQKRLFFGHVLLGAYRTPGRTNSLCCLRHVPPLAAHTSPPSQSRSLPPAGACDHRGEGLSLCGSLGASQVTARTAGTLLHLHRRAHAACQD